MKTIVVTNSTPQGEVPSVLLEQAFLVDRPFLLHVVEQLIAAGIRDVTFAGDDSNIVARKWLGDGARWGCRFDYLATDVPSLPSAIRHWAHNLENVDILIGHSNTWFPLASSDVQAPMNGGFVDFRSTDSHEDLWQGWSIAPAEWLEDSSFEDWSSFGEQIQSLAQCSGRTREFDNSLRGATLKDLLDAQQLVLNGLCPELSLYGRIKAPGVRICRNAKIDRSAKIQGPVLIGDDVWIGKGCVIEAGTVIGHGSVIDRGTRLQRSCVMPRTIVDPDLHLVDCWIDSHRIYNVRLGGSVSSLVWNLTAAI